MAFTYSFPRPALAVDIVVFGFDGGALKVLLIERSEPVGHARWALPGGFVHIDETLDEAAARELHEETGLERIFLEQLYTFGSVDRDPRERVVSVSYFALVARQQQEIQAASDAKAAAWYALNKLPKLCFDHGAILRTAHERLRGKIRYAPIGFELLPPKFTLGALQQLYESILDVPLDKRNFRKKVLSYGLLQPLDEYQKHVAHRAARLYRFDRRQYRRLSKQGFFFEI